MGSQNAPIEVVLISDFQCTYCRDAAKTLKELYAQNREDIKLYFIHYPLDKTVNPYTPNSNHLYAGLAAKISICLSQTLPFWDVHDTIFANQENFSDEFFEEYIEMNNLRGCIEDSTTIEFLKINMDLGKIANVKGTPTLLLNGRPVSKWYDKKFLSKLIHFEKIHNLTIN